MKCYLGEENAIITFSKKNLPTTDLSLYKKKGQDFSRPSSTGYMTYVNLYNLIATFFKNVFLFTSLNQRLIEIDLNWKRSSARSDYFTRMRAFASPAKNEFVLTLAIGLNFRHIIVSCFSVTGVAKKRVFSQTAYPGFSMGSV